MTEPDEGEAVELEHAGPQPDPRPLRPHPRHIGLAALVAFVAAVFAAGLALAHTRSSSASGGSGTGIVVIDTNLGYQGERAAGTGMVLTSSGEVLTNNHVIRGATEIRVVVPKTGRSYAARVVGYDVADDVAVLQLSGASNLRTLPLGDSSSLSVGQSVRAIGNAGGTGSFTPASGRVTALGRRITVGNDQGGSEHLTGMIQTNAAVRPGDSGGPLLNSSGQAIGMDTAAAVGQGYQQAANVGWAIPINKAVSIAKQIQDREASATVHVGGTGFLGVEVAASSYGSGAAIQSVVPGGPADNAGLVPGDVITSLGGQAISSPAGLSAAVASQQPGASTSVTFVDQTGSTQTTTVQLANGPAQ
jgi:S1-C subfamily serine protease